MSNNFAMTNLPWPSFTCRYELWTHKSTILSCQLDWVEIPYSIVTFSLTCRNVYTGKFRTWQVFQCICQGKTGHASSFQRANKLVKLKIVKENLLLGFSNMLLFNFFPSNIYCTLCFERKQPGENSDMKQ